MDFGAGAANGAMGQQQGAAPDVMSWLVFFCLEVSLYFVLHYNLRSIGLALIMFVIFVSYSYCFLWRNKGTWKFL